MKKVNRSEIYRILKQFQKEKFSTILKYVAICSLVLGSECNCNRYINYQPKRSLCDRKQETVFYHNPGQMLCFSPQMIVACLRNVKWLLSGPEAVVVFLTSMMQTSRTLLRMLTAESLPSMPVVTSTSLICKN